MSNCACVHAQSHTSQVRLFCVPVDCNPPAPLSMELSRQEYWSGLPFPAPGDLPDPAIKPIPPTLAGRFFTTAPPEKSMYNSLWDGLSPDFSFFCKMHPPPPTEAGVRIGA